MAARTGIRFLYRISTNLTLLPPVALKRFAEHRFVVSISLDGGANVQDRYRPTLGGRGSYERIIRNARRVRDAGSDIIMVARMTVASSTPSLVDRVRDLWELNLFDYFQIYPAVYRESGVALPSGGCSSAAGEGRVINFMLQAEMPQQFREFLLEYPSFFTPENRFRGVLEYERTAEMLLDGKLALAFCSGGRKYFTHSPNGAVSPCHRLVGDERFDVGTGAEGIVKPLDEWRTSVDDHPVCSGCWARYVCGGGCKQENHLSTGDVNRLNPESCAYQLLLAEEVLKAVALAPADYRARPRQLDDVFVSCGRPVSANGRVPDPPAGAMEALRFFRPVVRESL
jgi:radical SAM protein with 4Fe4S-binding SPASM domain